MLVRCLLLEPNTILAKVQVLFDCCREAVSEDWAGVNRHHKERHFMLVVTTVVIKNKNLVKTYLFYGVGP